MNKEEERIKQCRKPEGSLGLEVATRMNTSHAPLWEWGLEHVSVIPGCRMLDVGCGGGMAIKLISSMSEGLKISGIDYSADMVKMSKETNSAQIESGTVEILEASVDALPFEDAVFDIATAFESYYFWPDLQEALKELKRVLKPGGTLLLVNEVYKHEDFEERNSYYASLAGMRYNTPEEFKEFLAEAGFSDIQIDTVPEKNWLTASAKSSK